MVYPTNPRAKVGKTGYDYQGSRYVVVIALKNTCLDNRCVLATEFVGYASRKFFRQDVHVSVFWSPLWRRLCTVEVLLVVWSVNELHSTWAHYECPRAFIKSLFKWHRSFPFSLCQVSSSYRGLVNRKGSYYHLPVLQLTIKLVCVCWCHTSAFQQYPHE
jgi:hypothetical protein